MLFKMLVVERAHVMSETDAPKPRQVFVTQSRVLATRVEEYFDHLLQSLSTRKKTKEELKSMSEKMKQAQEDAGLLYDVDDDITWKASLPSKFSLLEDKHFPLFLTFERVRLPGYDLRMWELIYPLQLASLLEGDIEDTEAKSLVKLSTKRLPMTYDVFLQKYWPHFSQDLTKHIGQFLYHQLHQSADRQCIPRPGLGVQRVPWDHRGLRTDPRF